VAFEKRDAGSGGHEVLLLRRGYKKVGVKELVGGNMKSRGAN
jgi:hypothetical protein